MKELTIMIKYFTIFLLIGLIWTATANQPSSATDADATEIVITKPTTTKPATTKQSTVTPAPTATKVATSSTNGSTKKSLCVTTAQGQGNILGGRKRAAKTTTDVPDCITTTNTIITTNSTSNITSSTTNGISSTPKSSTINTYEPNISSSSESVIDNNISSTSTMSENETSTMETNIKTEGSTTGSTEQTTDTNGMTILVETITTHAQTLDTTDERNEHSTSQPIERFTGSSTSAPSSSTTNKSGRNDKNTSSNEAPYDHELAIIFGVMLGLMLLAIFIFCVHRCYKRERQETMMTGGGDISIKMSKF